MRPLLPTFHTANCRPSRPAEPPSGVISHLSSSWPVVFALVLPTFPSATLRSVAGSKDLGVALGDKRRPDLRAAPGATVPPTIPPFAAPAFPCRLSPFRPSLGGVRLRRGSRGATAFWGGRLRVVGGRLSGAWSGCPRRTGERTVVGGAGKGSGFGSGVGSVSIASVSLP